MTLRALPVEGKGVYIWRQANIFKGDISRIVNALVSSNTDFVCIKIHDGTSPWLGMGPLVSAIRSAGIRVLGWGYLYGNNPTREAQVSAQVAKFYNIEAFLIDAESHYKGKLAAARTYSRELRRLLPNMPLALNSYWKPSYHPTLPFAEFRAICDFDAPQVYHRAFNPVGKLLISKQEYGRMSPRLPLSLVAGEMYTEHGITGTPDQLRAFMTAANEDPEIRAVVMWSMDQIEKVPQLWSAYSKFKWNKQPVSEPEQPGNKDPLYEAKVKAHALTIRSGPMGRVLGYLSRGDKVTVYAENGKWAAIVPACNEWVYSVYLTKIKETAPPPAPVEGQPLWHGRVTAYALTVRRGPGVAHPTVRYLSQYADVAVYAESGQWVAINPAKTEWVHTGYLAKISATQKGLYDAITIGRLNVRRAPNVGGTWIRTLPVGTTVTVWGVRGDWAAINQTQTEWAHINWLQKK
jgi:uncharacterized protein YgiM (DUF1202 family)